MPSRFGTTVGAVWAARIAEIGRLRRQAWRSDAPGLRSERRARCFRRRERRLAQRVGAAFDDGALEQAGGERGGQLRVDAQATGGLTENRHIVGVTAKGPDVALHPTHRRLLIQKPVVARRAGEGLGAQSGMGKKTELTESVVDGDDDNPLRHQAGGIEAIAFSDDKSPSMDPEHHGKEMRLTPVCLA